MSYEGYVQYLCEKGHYHTQDCYADDATQCPTCKRKIIWQNSVDETNGSFDEQGIRIDGCVKLRIKSQRKCKQCKTILETLYFIPKKRSPR